MSIRGVTFDNQQVTASDHGTLFKQVFRDDGILTGCAITTSGSTINIAAGYLVIAGRLIQNTAQASLTVSASGNYVRILATIDTSQTATTSAFNQVSFSLDYAATLDGFAALIQNDINAGSGNIYQAALVVYTLSGSTPGSVEAGPYYATVSANYAAEAGAAATAAALASSRNFSISDYDGSNTGPSTAFKGIAAALLKLPQTIKATFVGSLTGNVTGNVSGSSGSCTGNAATATTASKVGHALSFGSKSFNGSADRTIVPNDLLFLGANPISSTTSDTVTAWQSLGTGFAWYTENGEITDKPTTYGVLISYVHSSIVSQLWVSYSAGNIYHRVGNTADSETAWRSSWVRVANQSEIPTASSSDPLMDGTASAGSGTAYARGNHRHPTDTSRAPLASPVFTGTPKAQTAAAGTNTTQIATTEFVTRAVGGVSVPAASTTAPLMDGTASYGSGTTYARANHVHPTDTSRAALASPIFTGTPKAPTAATSTNNTQIATTEFVKAVIAALTAAQIPDLPASKIASGTLDAARIPNLSASKITSDTLSADRIPNLSAAKITSGTLDAARIPALSASKISEANTTLASFSGRRIYISQSAPTTGQGSVGDIWIQY